MWCDQGWQASRWRGVLMGGGAPVQGIATGPEGGVLGQEGSQYGWIEQFVNLRWGCGPLDRLSTL